MTAWYAKRKRANGKWEGRIIVGHKKNGEPIFRYVYGKTQKELLDKLHRSIELYQDAELTEDSQITLGERLDKWMNEYMDGTLRDSTKRCYRQYIDVYIKPILGGKQVSKVTSADVQKMYGKLKREGRIHPHPEYGRQLSDTTICKIHNTLHHAMKTAEQVHIIVRTQQKG